MKLYEVKFRKITKTQFPCDCEWKVLAKDLIRACEITKETSDEDTIVIVISASEIHGTVLVDKY